MFSPLWIFISIPRSDSKWAIQFKWINEIIQNKSLKSHWRNHYTSLFLSNFSWKSVQYIPQTMSKAHVEEYCMTSNGPLPMLRPIFSVHKLAILLKVGKNDPVIWLLNIIDNCLRGFFQMWPEICRFSRCEIVKWLFILVIERSFIKQFHCD